MKNLLITLSSIFYFFCAKTQPGNLDLSFGEQGIATSSQTFYTSKALAIQRDGKIVIGNDYSGFAIRRLKDDGRNDNSFGESGLFILGSGSVQSVKILPDDKILIAGWIVTNNVNVCLARLMPEGVLDSSFGENGIVITDIGKNDYTTSMTIDANDKILVTGNKQDNENDIETYFLLRYLHNGSLDENFSDDCILVATLCCPIEMHDIIVQEDNKIVIAGEYAFDKRFLAIRFLSDGTIDMGFGKSGIASLFFNDQVTDARMNSMHLLTDGKILLGGSVHFGDNVYKSVFALMRLSTDGEIDHSFAEDGLLFTNFEDLGSEVVKILIQPDNKIIVAGTGFTRLESGNYFSSHFVVARYSSDGLIDPGFGNNGLEASVQTTSLKSYSAALQEDGKIIVSGLFNSNYLLARYNGGEGSLPITYKNFTATQKNGFIQLNWQTANEINNSYFEVEHSSSGTTFNEIARVNSISHGNETSYTYADKLVQDGKNYYRLKQVDKDGKSSYSKTISIQFSKNSSIKIQPNPAKDKITVSGLTVAENNTLIITDMVGNILKKINTVTALQEINVQQLVPGNYILTVKNRTGLFQMKFIKQ